MILHYLYIIYSQTADKYYVGETDDPEKRLQEHIFHRYKKGFTKAAADWKLVLKFKTVNREQAIYLEQFIKRMKSRKFIEKIIAQPAILDEILLSK